MRDVGNLEDWAGQVRKFGRGVWAELEKGLLRSSIYIWDVYKIEFGEETWEASSDDGRELRGFTLAAPAVDDTSRRNFDSRLV